MIRVDHVTPSSLTFQTRLETKKGVSPLFDKKGSSILDTGEQNKFLLI